MQDVTMLLQALPYIREFRDKLFVVKFGGELLRDHEHLDAIAGDLTLLSMVGIRLVVVHGGGPQANELSESLGYVPNMIGGRRVTDEAALEVAKMVFAGKINTEVISALQKHGGRAIGLTGVDGGLVKVHKRPITTVVEDGVEREIDFGHVGDVDAIEPRVITDLVERNFIPVVSSLAADKDGQILNINADTVASEIAAALRAEKFFVMTSVPGVYKDFETKREIFSVLTASEARELIENGTAGRGMAPKLLSCARAAERGVRETHIINGLTRHSLLLETFTKKGIGSMVIKSRDAAVDAQ